MAVTRVTSSKNLFQSLSYTKGKRHNKDAYVPRRALCTSGVNCSSSDAYPQMMAILDASGAGNGSNHVQCYRSIQAFDPAQFDYRDPKNWKIVNHLGVEFAKRAHPNEMSVVITQADTTGNNAYKMKVLHNHIITCSRNIYNHKAMRGIEVEWHYASRISDAVIKSHGYQTLPQQKISRDRKTHAELANHRNPKRYSYVADLKDRIRKSVAKSASWKEFIANLKDHGVKIRAFRMHRVHGKRVPRLNTFGRPIFTKYISYSFIPPKDKDHRKNAGKPFRARSRKLGLDFGSMMIGRKLNSHEQVRNHEPAYDPSLDVQPWLHKTYKHSTSEVAHLDKNVSKFNASEAQIIRNASIEASEMDRSSLLASKASSASVKAHQANVSALHPSHHKRSIRQIIAKYNVLFNGENFYKANTDKNNYDQKVRARHIKTRSKLLAEYYKGESNKANRAYLDTLSNQDQVYVMKLYKKSDSVTKKNNEELKAYNNSAKHKLIMKENLIHDQAEFTENLLSKTSKKQGKSFDRPKSDLEKEAIKKRSSFSHIKQNDLELSKGSAWLFSVTRENYRKSKEAKERFKQSANQRRQDYQVYAENTKRFREEDRRFQHSLQVVKSTINGIAKQVDKQISERFSTLRVQEEQRAKQRAYQQRVANDPVLQRKIYKQRYRKFSIEAPAYLDPSEKEGWVIDHAKHPENDSVVKPSASKSSSLTSEASLKASKSASASVSAHYDRIKANIQKQLRNDNYEDTYERTLRRKRAIRRRRSQPHW